MAKDAKPAAAKRAPIPDVKLVKPQAVPLGKGTASQTHRTRRAHDLTLHDAAMHHQQIHRGSPPAMELPKRG